MNPSSAPSHPPTLSRQTAWGCFTTNLALPGFGSLAAGRRVGYIQAAFGITGLAFTVVFGLRAIWWFLSNWARLHDPMADPVDMLTEMWSMLKAPFLGMALFAVGWIWALLTSANLLREAKRAESRKTPPKLG
jgi:hypothetical protein